MRFKIDENLHPDVAALLREHGHDAVSVWDQHMRGADDPHLAAVCRAEGRVLLTFDLGFADIRQYPPEQWPGFVVLRLSSQDRAHVTAVLRRVVSAFKPGELAGRLWIVTERDIRVRGGAQVRADAAAPGDED